MKVGLSLPFAHTSDWQRFLATERREPASGRPAIPDVQIWDEDIQLGLEAEPLGFESIFCPEHHFTPYCFSTDPLQVLTYFAGRTEQIDLGTMVVVLPWHHPLRVAEQATMLQNLLGPDRDLLLGLGRGLARREYNAFGVDMSESRQRFAESVDILKLALTEDRFSYQGTHFTIPDTAMRPYPRDRRLLENLYGAWGSPPSAPIAAELGLKPFLIPQKPFKDYTAEMDEFAKVRADSGYAPAQPMIVVWVYCAETEAQAHAGAMEHMTAYARTPVLHYEIDGAHFAGQKGYEHYATTAQAVEKYKVDLGAQLGQIWLDNHVWGTPEQCFDKIQAIHKRWGPSHLIATVKYGAMPADEARLNMRLFAKEVLPAVKALQDPAPLPPQE